MHLAVCVKHRSAATFWCVATCSEYQTIGLWCVVTCSEYRTIGQMFRVARSTFCIVIHDTCKAIIHVLLDAYIKFPQGSELCDVVSIFRSMVQCAGVIDGSHVPVTPPALNHMDYYNRKGWYLILIQTVVDHKYLFVTFVLGGQRVYMMLMY